MPRLLQFKARFVPKIERFLLFLIRYQHNCISPGKGQKEDKITYFQKVSDSHYPLQPYFFIHLQQSLLQKASGWW